MRGIGSRIECRPDGLVARSVGALLRGFERARREGLTAGVLVLTLGVCAVAPLARASHEAASTSSRAAAGHEWPPTFDGKPLRPLGLSAVEQRFATHFPGAIGRFSDGERLLVLRSVERPTRMLHPAADCYRGLGYRIAEAHLERDGDGRMWRCFATSRENKSKGDDATRLRVCERIAGADGRAWTDTSAPSFTVGGAAAIGTAAVNSTPAGLHSVYTTRGGPAAASFILRRRAPCRRLPTTSRPG